MPPYILSETPLPICRQAHDPGWQLVALLERAAGAGAWVLELPSACLTWTDRLAELLEMPPDGVLAYKDALDFYAPESRELMAAALHACMAQDAPFDEEVQIITAHGQRLWVRSLGEAIHDASGTIVRIQGVLQNLTEKRRAAQESQSLTMRLSSMLASTSEAFVTLDMEGRLTYVNHESEKLLSLPGADLLGKPIWQVLRDNGGDRVRSEIRQALSGRRPIEFEAFYAAPGKWLELRAYPFEEGLAVYLRDVSERKAAEDEIEHLAFYDMLTQLPNRQLLKVRLESALAQSAHHPQIGALMFIDLDNFKVLNDTLGHFKGDMLLQRVAVRLSSCMRKDDTVARLGGDEFVVMLENLGSEMEAAIDKSKAVGEKILALLSEPYDLAGYQYYGTCSIGITTFGNYQQSVGDLLKQADMAMYEAKAAGRNALCWFDPEMQAAATASAELNSQLRQGLRNQEFVLHYQPQVGRGGHMIGVEALVRWLHPERGMVFPDEFIPSAEDSGLILQLGRWALVSACAQLALWARRPETEMLTIAVNVSVRQFRHPEFFDQVMDIIDQAGICAHRLKLELTESLLAADIDVTIAKMGRLKNAGVTLAIDDFGVGYSALAYLKRMPLDQLKIDRAFVKDVLTDPNDAAIARTIIGLAQSLGLAVMAEGVETEAQREFLAWHGCETYQGYLFSKALPIDELEAFMQSLPGERGYVR